MILLPPGAFRFQKHTFFYEDFVFYNFSWNGMKWKPFDQLQVIEENRAWYVTLPTDSSRLASSVQVAGFIKQYENMLFVTVKVNILIKGIPGCLFTRTSLPKSLNNLEPICNYVNVKCSRLVILRIISVTSTFTVSEIYATNVNLTNLKVIIFPVPLYLTV